MPSVTSLVGAATAGYSIALVAAPRILLAPCGLEDSADTRLLAGAIGPGGRAAGAAGRLGAVTVVVVGAGPVGLTAAVLLARRGVDVLVLDRHVAAYPQPRAV
ncbi:MAG: Monooxygenase, FAD-binding, partial [Modestobacter sp.]|nr:Monooxygenase, FAD-binding [Modestobacter sp.]